MSASGWSSDNALHVSEQARGLFGARRHVASGTQSTLVYDATKRLVDVAGASLLLILSLPVLIFCAALILAATRQNPLLAQRRIGWRGQEFTMLKLRTMRSCESDEAEFAEANDVFVLKEPIDPRVTSIGRLMRRCSLDELPQLLNVIAGQMSLVGPRPSLPCEVARYPRAWLRRFSVKPGISGLWQVSGRSDVPPRRRIALDRHYVSHRSLALDLAILLRTVVAVLSRRGAW